MAVTKTASKAAVKVSNNRPRPATPKPIANGRLVNGGTESKSAGPSGAKIK